MLITKLVHFTQNVSACPDARRFCSDSPASLPNPAAQDPLSFPLSSFKEFVGIIDVFKDPAFVGWIFSVLSVFSVPLVSVLCHFPPCACLAFLLPFLFLELELG